MEKILEENIRAELVAKDMSVADLSRVSNVPYRTLQDILALKQAAKITTVSAIARGLGTTAGRLLEERKLMEKPLEKSRSDLLSLLIQIAVDLDDLELRDAVDLVKRFRPNEVLQSTRAPKQVK